MTAVVNLGVKDLGYLKLGFIINQDWRWRRLDMIRYWVWECRFHMETWNTGCTARKLLGSRRVTEWVPRARCARISYRPRNLSESFFDGRDIWKTEP